jgi:hypothetical protein
MCVVNLKEPQLSGIWPAAVVLLPLHFSVLFSGEWLCRSSGIGPTICGGDGLQVQFEFCTGGFLVAQWFWFLVVAANLVIQWVLSGGCGVLVRIRRFGVVLVLSPRW